MSKKDYIALADYMRKHPISFPPASIELMANFLAYHCPGFNKDRWIAYAKREKHGDKP